MIETDGVGKIVQIVDHLLENIGLKFLVKVEINESHKKRNPQYLNHMNGIKFLNVFLCFNLPLIVFMAHDVPSKWDLLKVLIVCNQGCESDAETRRGTRRTTVILGVTNDRREGKKTKNKTVDTFEVQCECSAALHGLSGDGGFRGCGLQHEEQSDVHPT